MCVQSHCEFGVFKDDLLESKCDVCKVAIKVALISGSLEKCIRLRLQLVNLGSETSVHLQFIAVEVHLSESQRHTLQVELSLLFVADLVLKVS